MFREMRRKRQELTKKQCEEILCKGSHGVLALSGDEGYPYALPISYVYDGKKIYFHSAASGHKIDAVKSCPKASFCVVARDDIVPEEYTTYFKSVIVFGNVEIVQDENEKMDAINKLALKYAPNDSEANRQAAIRRDWAPLCMLAMRPRHISGKQAIELVKGRNVNGENKA